jgi:hypothetical protein
MWIKSFKFRNTGCMGNNDWWVVEALDIHEAVKIWTNVTQAVGLDEFEVAYYSEPYNKVPIYEEWDGVNEEKCIGLRYEEPKPITQYKRY